MKLYTITRTLLRKRLQLKGISEKEITLIVVAIFSYLHSFSINTGGSFLNPLPLKLANNDFMFLKLLYEDDDFLSLFVDAYRDSQNPSIVSSSSLTSSDRMIKDLISQPDTVAGIYDYTINFDEFVMKNQLGSEETFKIVDLLAKEYSLDSSSSKNQVYKEEPIIKRTDDKLSYTDSVMASTPRLDRLSISDEDYNKIGVDVQDVEITMINKGPISAVNAGVKSSPVKQSSKTIDQPASIRNGSIKENPNYPVLNFLLSRTQQ